MASSGSGCRRLSVSMRKVDRKEAKSAAWIMKRVSGIGRCSGQAYEDEDDIEQILPLALALAVLDASIFEVISPSRFLLIIWIWKQSDWFAVGQANLLSGASAIGRGELASEVGIILN